MKKPLLLIFIFFIGFHTKAQTTFQSGYFINNIGEKTNCLIKNLDWKKNPKMFDFKISENTEAKTAIIDSVQEFAIFNSSKYVRFTVDIDTSSTDLSELSLVKEPTFINEQVFLKTILEGKASLYLFDNGDEKFFYKTSTNVEQLIFKIYSFDAHKLSRNEKFKKQLWNNLQCKYVTMEIINNLDYNLSDLYNVFEKYNECTNTKFIDYRIKRKKGDLFNLSIQTGLNYSAISMYGQNDYTKPYSEIDFGSKLTFSVGAELEFVFPFNNNKWSLIAQPNYQYFKGNQKNNSAVKQILNL